MQKIFFIIYIPIPKLLLKHFWIKDSLEFFSHLTQTLFLKSRYGIFFPYGETANSPHATLIIVGQG